MISSLGLVVTILFMVLVIGKNFMFLKYILLMVYIRGIVVFVLYISCSLVDYYWGKFNIFIVIIISVIFVGDIYDLGLSVGYSVGFDFDRFLVFFLLLMFFI